MTTPVPVVPRKPLKYIKDEVQFYAHQIIGARWGARVNSFIFGHEMGLGKSLMAFTVAAIDFEQGYARRVLYVTEASLLGNVADDLQDYTHFSYTVLNGTPAKRSKMLAEFDSDFLIASYDGVVAHVRELNEMRFDIVIVDEAHDIKTYFGEKKDGKAKKKSSQRARAVHELRAGRFVLMSGSIMLNKPDELWSPLHRIDPVSYPNYWRFVNRFCKFGGFNGKQIVGVMNERELRDRLSAVMLRAEKKDCLDLPDKQIIQIKVDLHPEQQKLYDEAEEVAKQDDPRFLTPEGLLEIGNPMIKYMRLRQICATPATLGFDDHSGKLDRVVHDIVELAGNGHKTVVFTQFRAALACCAARLDKHGLPVFQLHGDVDKMERVPIIKRWAASSEPGVIVASLKVAGVGLNMTAARHGLFIDKLYVPKLNEQAQDRLHRIGADSTHPVQIREYIARDTVESRIETILRRKDRLFDALVKKTGWDAAITQQLQQEGI